MWDVICLGVDKALVGIPLERAAVVAGPDHVQSMDMIQKSCPKNPKEWT